ncbi:MAG: hypothetical protein JNK49_17895 [Planctomycetes bacterium]|nr:hypothetical protein [Planctomycetota bacterium]
MSARLVGLLFAGPALLLAGSLSAQAQPPVPGAAPTPPAAQPPVPQSGAATPPAAPAQDPAVATAKFLKVVVDGAKLQCWPSPVAEPPCFEDVLAKDQVLAVGALEGGFRAVELPLGPLGYVNKRFTVATDDGVVKTKGNKVAFRYRAKATEAPVAQLADGTALVVVGESDEWWRVRVPGQAAWLPVAALGPAGLDDTAAAAAVATLAEQQRAEVQARLERIAAIKARAEQDRADEAAVRVVEAAFSKELQKPSLEQQYEPLELALEQLEGKFDAQSAGRASAASLRQRLGAQKLVVDAIRLLDKKPVPPPTPPQPVDELAKLEAIGWLRYEASLTGPGTYYLERGNVKQYVVTCSSRRFELALFVNREIGVNGSTKRPSSGLPALDVERIEVLGAMRR